MRETASADHDIAFWLALASTRMEGMADEAMEWVRRAVRLGNENYPLFADSPKLDPLRDRPAVRGARGRPQGALGAAQLRRVRRRLPGGDAVTAPKELLERIQLRLEESFIGIGEVVGDLPPADVADLLNQLTLAEAATVITMLPVPRAVEVFDQPTLTPAGRDPREPRPRRAPRRSWKGISADERTDIVQHMGERERRKLLPKLKPGGAGRGGAPAASIPTTPRAGS